MYWRHSVAAPSYAHSTVGAATECRPYDPFHNAQLLLNLLDQTQGVIAGDERDVFVSADLLKQLE